MNNEERNFTLAIDQRYLIRIDEQADFGSANKTIPGQIVGEALIEVSAMSLDGLSVRLVRLGLVSPGFLVNEEVSTGRISIGALHGGGEVRVGEHGISLDLGFEAQVVYQEISRQQGYDAINDHVYATPHEIHAGRLTGDLVREGGDDNAPQLVLLGGSLQLQYQERGLGLIKRVDASISGQLLDRLPGVPDLPADQRGTTRSVDDADEGEGADPSFHFNAVGPGAVQSAEVEAAAEGEPAAAASGCPSDLFVRRRTLRVHPVVLSSGGAVTGTTTAAQINAARGVWGKACIDLDVLAHESVSLPAVMPASDFEGIADLFTSPDLHAVCVFFTSDQLLGQGGGVTIDGGTGLAKVVITDSVVDNNGDPLNPNLLAHELGHVLHGLHPDDPPLTGWWNALAADGRTIMSPTGDPAVRNRSKNTFFNCAHAENTAIITASVDGCMRPDPS